MGYANRAAAQIGYPYIAVCLNPGGNFLGYVIAPFECVPCKLLYVRISVVTAFLITTHQIHDTKASISRGYQADLVWRWC